MGCSNGKAQVPSIKWKGPGLRKEYSDPCQPKYVGNLRKKCEAYAMNALKDKRSSTFIDQCTHDKFTIPGPDGNQIDIGMIKDKTNIDAKDLTPVVHFHGGKGYAGSEEPKKYVESRLAVENKVCYFNV